MEEADVLCNRIGIVNNGVLKCIGSQVRLKTLYGGGYHLFVNCQKAKYLKELKERKMRIRMRKQSGSSAVAHYNSSDNDDSDFRSGPAHQDFQVTGGSGHPHDWTE
jgi:ABC-type multidrug transport system ATPase subunit